MKLIRQNSEDLKRWRKRDWVKWGTTRETCGEKIIYRTYQEAEAALVEQENKWTIKLRIYNDCEHCVYYHLTKQVYT